MFSLPTNITEILWSLSLEVKWKLSPYLFYKKYFCSSSSGLHVDFGQLLACYQPMTDKLERCHLVGVTPKETPPVKAKQTISLMNKQQETRMTFDMSKGRDSWVQIWNSVQLHSNDKRVGGSFGNICRRAIPFLQFFSLTKIKDFCLARSAYLCHRWRWGKLWECFQIPGTVLEVWYCFSWLVRRSWRDKDEFRNETADGLLAALHLLSSTPKYPHLICVQGHPTNIHLNSRLLSHFSSPFPPLHSSTLKGMKHFYITISCVIKICPNQHFQKCGAQRVPSKLNLQARISLGLVFHLAFAFS